MAIPGKLAALDACPRRREHVHGPDGYVHWHEWAERKSRTHEQRQCECGYWMLWVRR